MAGSVTPALSRVTVRLFHVSFLFSEPQFSASVLSWCASWPHFCIWEPGFWIPLDAQTARQKPELGSHFYIALSRCIGTLNQTHSGSLMASGFLGELPFCSHLHMHIPTLSLEISIILGLRKVDPKLSPLKAQLGKCFKTSCSTSILLS